MEIEIERTINIPLTRELLWFCTNTFSKKNPDLMDTYKVKEKQKKGEVIEQVIRGYTVDYKEQKIKIGRGLLPQLKEYLNSSNIEYKLVDRTFAPKIDSNIWFEFEDPSYTLTEYQEIGKRAFLRVGQGTISFDCGMGKTVLALNILAALKIKTIILLHTKALMKQWIKEIQENIQGKYTIGVIGDSTIKFGDITVALFQSLYSIPIPEVYDNFGLVIVDECHHIPAETFLGVLRKFNAKHFLGLSATLVRKDRKEFLIDFSIGKCLYQKRRVDSGMEQILNVRRMMYLPKKTKVLDKRTKMMREKKLNFTRKFNKKASPNWVDAIGGICLYRDRTIEILDDIKKELSQGRKCLILSDRVEHCKEIYSELQQCCKVKLAIGGEETDLEEYKNTPEALDAIVGTKIADEGLNVPYLDTLFLTCPVSLKDVYKQTNTTILDQRIGRVARIRPGKKQFQVYLYVDVFISFFQSTCSDIIHYLESTGFQVRNLN